MKKQVTQEVMEGISDVISEIHSHDYIYDIAIKNSPHFDQLEWLNLKHVDSELTDTSENKLKLIIHRWELCPGQNLLMNCSHQKNQPKLALRRKDIRTGDTSTLIVTLDVNSIVVLPAIAEFEFYLLPKE